MRKRHLILIISILVLHLTSCSPYYIIVKDVSPASAFVQRSEIKERFIRLYQFKNEDKVLFETIIDYHNIEDNTLAMHLAAGIRECYKKWDKKEDFFEFVFQNLEIKTVPEWIVKETLEQIKPVFRVIK